MSKVIMQKATVENFETKRFFIRGKSNLGDNSKQYFVVAKSKGFEETLVCRTLVLAKYLDLYIDTGFRIVKTFGDYCLYERVFSIKTETLKEVIEVLNL